jgi:hypothetical protein
LDEQNVFVGQVFFQDDFVAENDIFAGVRCFVFNFDGIIGNTILFCDFGKDFRFGFVPTGV